jgi:hypothetical protein
MTIIDTFHVHYNCQTDEEDGRPRIATEGEAALYWRRSGDDAAVCFQAAPVGGWSCSRVTGHDGSHIAMQDSTYDNPTGRVCMIWSADTPTGGELRLTGANHPHHAEFMRAKSELENILQQYDNVTDAQRQLLNRDEVYLVDSNPRNVRSRLEYVTEYAELLGGETSVHRTQQDIEHRDNHRLHSVQQYVSYSYTEMWNLADIIVAAEERSRGMMRFGVLADVDINRGRRTVQLIRTSQEVPTDATVADVLGYWQHRHAAYIGDIVHCSNTIRAAARAHSWHDLHQRTINAMRSDGTLVSPQWHEHTNRPVGLRLTTPEDNIVDAVPYVVQPPAKLSDLHDDTSVQAMCQHIYRLEETHHDEISAMTERLLELAGDQSWCGEYEQNVERLNSGLSSYMLDAGVEFKVRQREWLVTGTVSITIDVPISTTVSANGSDDAIENASDVDIDYSEIAESLGIDYRTFRNMNYDIGACDWTDADPA